MITEKDVIDYIRKRVSAAPLPERVTVPPGSDCFAFKPPEGKHLLVTKDILVDGVHFKRTWCAADVLGRRAALVNFSDIAAGGGRPLYLFLGLGLPQGIEDKEVCRLIDGVFDACADYGVQVAGGDTVAAPSLTLSVTVIGEAEKPMKRYPARPGEKVFLTGEIGAAFCGYYALENSLDRKECINRFLLPDAHVKQGVALAGLGVRVCEDLSDGLARDLGNICAESQTGAVIYEEKLPVHQGLADLGFDAVEKAASFGDDYVLVFTADDQVAGKLAEVDFPVYWIGEIVEQPGVILVRTDGRRVELNQGYLHRF